jgi:heme A synthase
VQPRFARYAWSVLGFNLLVIVWGALVRASKSGDGCGSHWPLCNGQIVPLAPNLAMWIEYAHRLTSGLALISVIALAFWARRAFIAGHPARRAAVFSAIFIFTEALLGAGLVLFRYVGADASLSRAAYLSAHLINTLLLLAAVALTAWWGSGKPRLAPEAVRQNRLLAGSALAGAIVLGVSGAIAALGDTLFPSASLAAGWQADFSSASHLFVRLRVWHPLLAVLVSGIIVVSAVVLSHRAPAARKLGNVLALLVGLQLCAGVLNLWLLAPVWMQLVHLFCADLVWISLVLFAASAMATGSPSVVLSKPASAHQLSRSF